MVKDKELMRVFINAEGEIDVYFNSDLINEHYENPSIFFKKIDRDKLNKTLLEITDVLYKADKNSIRNFIFKALPKNN